MGAPPGFVTEMNDVWTHWLGKALFFEYDPQQRFKVAAYGPRVDDVRFTIVGGERDGEVWSLEEKAMFIQEVGKKRRRRTTRPNCCTSKPGGACPVALARC